jgi:hypothetical protein
MLHSRSKGGEPCRKMNAVRVRFGSPVGDFKAQHCRKERRG